jgi:hypothetical protein
MTERVEPETVADSRPWLRRPRTKRTDRPERIPIPGDELVRNDLIAKEDGVTERTLNRGDKEGDSYTYVGGVKYRPYKKHKEYLASRIRRLNPARAARAARRRT